MTRRAERGALAAMVVATLLWGGTFVAIRDTVTTLSPQALVFGRFAVAAVLYAVLLAVRRRAPGRRMLAIGAGNAVLMCGSFYLQALGLRMTSAGSSAFLTCAGTLFAAFYAWPLLGQRPSRAVLAGIALALVGSALLSLDGALRLGPGEAITLLGAALYALQIVWLGANASRLEPLALVAVQTAGITVAMSPFAGEFASGAARLDGAGWGRFLYLALAGSAIAPWLQIVAQRTLPPARIGLLFALEPVFALAFALTLGGEQFAWRWWVGAALILAGVLWVEGSALSAGRDAAGPASAPPTPTTR